MPPLTRMPRIIICDADPNLREELRLLFNSKGIEVCGEAKNGIEIIQKVDEQNPDVVLLDLDIPKGSGLKILPVLRELKKNLCIIILTKDSSSDSVHTAISLGAKGYILKHAYDPTRLFQSIEKAVGYCSAEHKTMPIQEIQILNSPEEGSITVITDEIQNVRKIYVTGGLHVRETGGVYMYHPLMASWQTGSLFHTVREVLAHPQFFQSVLKKINVFQEIASILYEQQWNGRIMELLLKPVLELNDNSSLCFALRSYECDELINLPLGLHHDGSPYVIPDKNPEMIQTDIWDKPSVMGERKSIKLSDYIRSFNGLSLELCLFLSTFNIQEIIKTLETSSSKSDEIVTHIHTVRDYAKWQEIPKAVLLGRLQLLPLPNSAEEMLVLTSSLSPTKTDSIESEDILYWMSLNRYHIHLQDFRNRWRYNVLPLLQTEEIGTFSVLIDRLNKHKYGVKSTKNPAEVMDEIGYKQVTLEDFVKKYPAIQLSDLMRPLLMNAFMARNPSIRVNKTLDSPIDAIERGKYLKNLLAGTGLDNLKKSKPFIYNYACDELNKKRINKLSLFYPKELVSEIITRVRNTQNLKQLSKSIPYLSAEEKYKRRRDIETSILSERFKRKYG